MSSKVERRRHERFGFRVPAQITFGNGGRTIRGHIMNLSASGVFAIIDEPIPRRASIQLRFRIKPGTWCEASGHSTRVLPIGRKHALGVDFTSRNAGFAFFVRHLALATKRASLSQEMDRVCIRVGRPD